MSRNRTSFGLACVLLLLSITAKADKFAFLVGVEAYKQQGVTKLGGACEDMRAMRQILLDRGFPKGNVISITSEDPEPPSKKRILDELGKLLPRIHEGDFLMFVYSGHGVQYDQPYLLPFDVSTLSEGDIKSSSISAAELRTTLGKAKAGVLFMAFDMCRERPEAGGKSLLADNNLRAAQAKSLTMIPSAGSQGPNSVITVFACSPRQRSWEIPIEGQNKTRGILSYCLEEGLRYGAADESGSVSAISLAEYVSWRVEEVARTATKLQQASFTVSNAQASRLVIASGVPKPPNAGPYDQAFHLGFEAFRQQKYATALSRFEDASKAKRSGSVLNMMGECHLLLKDRERAERLFREAIEAEPRAVSPRHNLAGVLVDAKKYPEAEKLYLQALEMNPGSIETLLDLATMYSLQGDHSKAEGVCLKAGELDPANPLVCYTLGSVNLRRAASAKNAADMQLLFEAAERCYRRSIDLDPEFWTPHHALGALLMSKRNFGEAEVHFKEVCRLMPEYGEGFAQLARAQVGLGKSAEARDSESKARARGYNGPKIAG